MMSWLWGSSFMTLSLLIPRMRNRRNKAGQFVCRRRRGDAIHLLLLLLLLVLLQQQLRLLLFLMMLLLLLFNSARGGERRGCRLSIAGIVMARRLWLVPAALLLERRTRYPPKGVRRWRLLGVSITIQLLLLLLELLFLT
jgi:hypothetical protein